MTDEIVPLIVKGLKIEEGLFTAGFRHGQGPFNCTFRCCYSGVSVDVAERDVLLKRADIVCPHLDATQRTDLSAWFEPRNKRIPISRRKAVPAPAWSLASARFSTKRVGARCKSPVPIPRDTDGR